MSDALAQIGPYSVEGELGRGGMGVVYKATDSRLGRVVAIKALPEHFADNPERLARFEREARTLATLNHPNVASIYGVEEHEGRRYLVLEYVEGETLADRLDRGPLPVDEALDLCAQVAAGMEAAHEAGVIHRDLKPANIRITPDGKAKVLDFGLARTEETSSSGSSVSQMQTLTTPHSPTTPGAILGTAPYMSPEQARGRKVDKRSDIWSFGVLLYECLTGMSPFIGETATDSIGAILHKDVDLDRLPRTTPRDVRRLIQRCLQRDRNERLRDIGDARIELHNAERASVDLRTGGRLRAIGVGAVALTAIVSAALGAGVVVMTTSRPAPARAIRASIEPAADEFILYSGDLAGPVEISPDGTRICYVSKREGEVQMLHIRALNEKTSVAVRGAEGATFPFWSPDGQSIGYFARGELRRYDLETKTNRTICPAPGGRGGAWLADDTIVFAPQFQSGLSRVPVTGGEPAPVTALDSARHTSHRWPTPTADRRGFLYVAVSHDPGKLDESAIFLWRSGDTPDVEVTRAQFNAQIVGDTILIVRDSALTAAPFNETTGAITGPARTIMENVLADISTWRAVFSASASGLLVFHEEFEDSFETQRVDAGSTYGEARLAAVVARDGRPDAEIAVGVPQNTVSVSSDNMHLAISGAPEEFASQTGFDIWIYRLLDSPDERNIQSTSTFADPPRRLTFLPGNEISPRWSPDGQWITFCLTAVPPGGPQEGLYRIRASGGREELLLPSTSDTSAIIPTDWTRDGRYIIYNAGPWIQSMNNEIYAFDLVEKRSVPLVTGPQVFRQGKVSPDGLWLAYRSNETGANEVYVIPFAPAWEEARRTGQPAPPADARWRISIAGSEALAWSPRGDELFYLSSSDTLVAVKTSSEGVEFIHDVGTALFDATRGEAGTDFAVLRNAQRFIVNSSQVQRRSSISLLTDWRALLRK